MPATFLVLIVSASTRGSFPATSLFRQIDRQGDPLGTRSLAAVCTVDLITRIRTLRSIVIFLGGGLFGRNLLLSLGCGCFHVRSLPRR